MISIDSIDVRNWLNWRIEDDIDDWCVIWNFYDMNKLEQKTVMHIDWWKNIAVESSNQTKL